MDQDDELAECKTKVYQQIGRNVVLFQQMEQLLKILLPRAKVSIPPNSDIEAPRETRYAPIEKRSLGELVNQLIDEVCVSSNSDQAEDPGRVQSGVTFRLRSSVDEVAIQRIKDLVKGRNQLVHHLLSQIDPGSPASWRKILGELENQEKCALSEIKRLRQLVELIEWSRSLISHPDVRQEIVYGPIREQLLGKLRAASAKSADPERWTPLKAAIHNEPRISPELLTEYLENFQIRSVSALLETVRDFEIRHVKDGKGKTRTYYRYTGTQDSTVPDTTV